MWPIDFIQNGTLFLQVVLDNSWKTMKATPKVDTGITTKGPLKRGFRDSGFRPLNGPEIEDSNFKQARIRDSNFIFHIQDSLYFLRVGFRIQIWIQEKWLGFRIQIWSSRALTKSHPLYLPPAVQDQSWSTSYHVFNGRPAIIKIKITGALGRPVRKGELFLCSFGRISKWWLLPWFMVYQLYLFK